MKTFGQWPLIERITNEEFLKLLPHLTLEQHFLTQIFVPKKKWIHTLEANLQTLQLKCGVCNRQVRFEDIKNHLMQNDHIMSVRTNVKQFYNPFYTYGKGDVKLARGEHVPPDIREKALREVNMQMKSFKKDCIVAKQFADIAQRRIRGAEEDQLIEASLSRKIENPEDMIVMVELPFEDIPKLLFCVVSGEWQTMLNYRSLTRKATFYCKICGLNCCGIESLNSHLNGFTHKLKQLEMLALCYEDSSRVNKNCCIHFGNSFSFSIKENAKSFTGNQVKNSSDSWVAKLPNEIAKKVKALNEFLPNILGCPENALDQSTINEDIGRDSKINCYENLGHLGVEYVLKIIKNENDREPKFECGLCEFAGDAKKMQRHLLIYEHKKKYLDLHYSDTIKKYEDLIGHMSYKDFRFVMGEVVNKVAGEIEKHHSRSLPYTVLLSDYKARRPDLIAEAYALLHASQNRGPSFSNILSKDDIRKIKNSATQFVENKAYENTEHIIFTKTPKDKIYLNQISHDPVVRLIQYNAKLHKNQTSRTSRSISPTHNKRYDANRAGSRAERSFAHVHEEDKGSKSPKNSRQRTFTGRYQDCPQPSNTFNHNIWEIYRREIAIAANDIEVAYETYRKNPESHPLYEEEWNNFWQHRKKELEREGYDHRCYNFQPEWVQYFKQRIEVLFGEELHKSKISIRHRLEIPLDAEEDCQRSHEPANQHPISRRIHNSEFLGDAIGRRKRQSSADYKGFVAQKKKIISEEMQGQQEEDLGINDSQLAATKIRDNHSNVIHVLRLMTALEEHLGSLGGKVMDLLSNALQLEKKYKESTFEFEANVLTIANCHLLETAMEKLKGILFAGFLDKNKVCGFNRVIQHTANLLKYAEKIGWRHENASEKINFHNISGGVGGINENTNGRCVPKVTAQKALSDTLMDLVNAPQTSKQQTRGSKEKFEHYTKDNSGLPDCPPPPNIRESSMTTNLLAEFKEQQSSSGLASFNTKLSFGPATKPQKLQRDLRFNSDNGQMQRNTISSGNNLYNNSFKNNNDTRTNINPRINNGSSVGGSINNHNGTALFRNSQFIPNMGENNAVYEGRGGGNRNQNWTLRTRSNFQ